MPKTSAVATCDYDTGTAGSGPSKCGKPAKYIWRDPDSGWKDRPVCGTHARSAARKFSGGIRPIGKEG
jgi:hypothetical protein